MLDPQYTVTFIYFSLFFPLASIPYHYTNPTLKFKCPQEGLCTILNKALNFFGVRAIIKIVR